MFFAASVRYLRERSEQSSTNERMLCKRVGKNLFLHATSVAKLRHRQKHKACFNVFYSECRVSSLARRSTRFFSQNSVCAMTKC